MSSTGRGAARAADDFYRTPAWTVDALLTVLGRIDGARILEPSAGDGAIVRRLIERGAEPYNVDAFELDHDRCMRVAGTGVRTWEYDFLLWDGAAIGGWPRFTGGPIRPVNAAPKQVRFDLVVMNPPFSAAQAHVEHAIRFLASGGTCAALLRLSFACSKKRAAFRAAHPFDLYPLAARPSFTAEALATMTNDDLKAVRKTVVRGKEELVESVDDVRARLRGTDSCDYAWFLFHSGRNGGRFSVLEGGK